MLQRKAFHARPSGGGATGSAADARCGLASEHPEVVVRRRLRYNAVMRLGPLVLTLIAGCTLSPDSTSATTDTTRAPNGTDSAGTTSAAATEPPTTTMSTSSSTTNGSSSTTGGTTMCSQFDCIFECNPWTQNCPDGQKCMPWADDGSSAWNATKCTDIMPNAGKPGDPCTAEGNGVSGVDSCEKASMCWDISQETGIGTCVGFCMGSQEAPTCPSLFNCVIDGSGTLILCLPGCDPLAQGCSNTDVCIPQPMGDGFVCVLDASGDMGQQNDPCEYANSCDPGLLCAEPAFATECDPMAPGCCLPFCDLTMPKCTNQGAQCVGWHEPGMAPPGLENVGICRLPP